MSQEQQEKEKAEKEKTEKDKAKALALKQKAGLEDANPSSSKAVRNTVADTAPSTSRPESRQPKSTVVPASTTTTIIGWVLVQAFPRVMHPVIVLIDQPTPRFAILRHNYKLNVTPGECYKFIDLEPDPPINNDAKRDYELDNSNSFLRFHGLRNSRAQPLLIQDKPLDVSKGAALIILEPCGIRKMAEDRGAAYGGKPDAHYWVPQPGYTLWVAVSRQEVQPGTSISKESNTTSLPPARYTLTDSLGTQIDAILWPRHQEDLVSNINNARFLLLINPRIYTNTYTRSLEIDLTPPFFRKPDPTHEPQGINRFQQPKKSADSVSPPEYDHYIAIDPQPFHGQLKRWGAPVSVAPKLGINCKSTPKELPARTGQPFSELPSVNLMEVDCGQSPPGWDPEAKKVSYFRVDTSILSVGLRIDKVVDMRCIICSSPVQPLEIIDGKKTVKLWRCIPKASEGKAHSQTRLNVVWCGEGAVYDAGGTEVPVTVDYHSLAAITGCGTPIEFVTSTYKGNGHLILDVHEDNQFVIARRSIDQPSTILFVEASVPSREN
jgi:hypothetical protein